MLRRLRRLPQFLRNRFSLGGLILLYHRVAVAESDPHALCISPAHFEEHLALLSGRARVVPLAEIVTRLRERRSVRGLVAITFDDGYADNLTTALPLLERYAAPATFFVVSGRIPFWWDRMAALPLDGARFRELYAELQPLPNDENQHRLDHLEAPADNLPLRMSDEQIVSAAAHPLITIGGHTLSHRVLATLSSGAQREEIGACRQALEELTGQRVRSFAYPYGTPQTFNAVTVALVRACGFEHACAAAGDVVSSSSDLFRLPRVPVSDVGGEQIARLARWLQLSM